MRYRPNAPVVSQIKHAVDCGYTIHWANESYKVVKDSLGQYLIKHESGHCIGLTHKDGKTLNGKDWQFFRGDLPRWYS